MKTLKLLKIYALIILFALNFIAAFLGSQVTQSLVLLVFSYHILYTTLSLILLVISHKLTSAQTLKNTFGWVRVEILGTLFNIIFFAALCFACLVEGVQTLAHSGHEEVQPDHPVALVIAGLVGIALHLLLYLSVGDLRKEGGFLSISGNDVVAARVVNSDELGDDATKTEALPMTPIGPVSSAGRVTKRKPSASLQDRTTQCSLIEESEALVKMLNAQEAIVQRVSFRIPIRHIVRDFICSFLLLAVGSLIIFVKAPQIEIADPLLGILAVIVLSITFYPSMKASGLILLQTVPKHIDVECLKKSILVEFPNILSIHDLHVWCLTSEKIIATCHVSLPHNTTNYLQLSRKLEQFMAQYGISLATIQPEFEKETRHSYSCMYKCSNKQSDCIEKKCCHENEDECEAVLTQKSEN